jgi:hypothetical protein
MERAAEFYVDFIQAVSKAPKEKLMKAGRPATAQAGEG